MPYTPTVWNNNAAPPISAANLNKMEIGIGDAHTALAALVPGSAATSLIVAEGTFTSVANLTVDGCFTSAFDNYKIVFIWSGASQTLGTLFRMRAGGVTETGNVYGAGVIYASNTAGPLRDVPAGMASSSFGCASLYSSTYQTVYVGTFIDPNRASRTAVNWSSTEFSNANGYVTLGTGQMSTSTQYDGFIVTTSAGTMSGTYRVYAESKSTGGSAADSDQNILANQIFS